MEPGLKIDLNADDSDLDTTLSLDSDDDMEEGVDLDWPPEYIRPHPWSWGPPSRTAWSSHYGGTRLYGNGQIWKQRWGRWLLIVLPAQHKANKMEVALCLKQVLPSELINLVAKAMDK